MKIYRIHSMILKGVKLDPKPSKCFIHDWEFLGVDVKDVQEELEGQKVIVYTGDFTSNVRFGKCPWCKSYPEEDMGPHMFGHNKSMIDLLTFKFQFELYREKLNLLRARIIDQTYFVYLNGMCQMCADMRARGRGLCSIPESARNKVRSLKQMGFSADNFPSSFLKRKNLGYLIGKTL